MTESDRKAFAGLMVGLCQTFRTEPVEGLIEGYWIALSDLKLEAVKHGVARCIKTSTFMPAPAEVIKESAKEHDRLIALDAFKCLLDALDRHGDSARIDFEDKAINVAVNRVGWDKLRCIGTDLNTEKLSKYFVSVYMDVAQGYLDHHRLSHYRDEGPCGEGDSEPLFVPRAFHAPRLNA